MADYEINWLPIETAPRDGTSILLVYSGSDNTAPIVSTAYWIADCNDGDGLWDHSCGQDGERMMSQDNWGWFPLPPAPPEKGTWAGDEWAARVAGRVNIGMIMRDAVMENDQASDLARYNSWVNRLPRDAGQIVAMDKTELANNHIDVIAELERLYGENAQMQKVLNRAYEVVGAALEKNP